MIVYSLKLASMMQKQHVGSNNRKFEALLWYSLGKRQAPTDGVFNLFN